MRKKSVSYWLHWREEVGDPDGIGITRGREFRVLVRQGESPDKPARAEAKKILATLSPGDAKTAKLHQIRSVRLR